MGFNGWWRKRFSVCSDNIKTIMKCGVEKVANYGYPVAWLNPKGEQKCNILINAQIFMRYLFIQTRETTEGTFL